MPKALLGILITSGIALLLFMLSVFTINETETAVRFQLGEIVQDNYKPGLHFKLPIIDTVRKFDARIQTLDTKPESFLTAEKKNVDVDWFVKWRIGDSRTYYTRLLGDPNRANAILQPNIVNGLRGEFSKRTLKEVISGDRDLIMDILAETAESEASEYGIDVVDVRIKRIDLPQDVSESVFRRMRAERERVARDFRSRGQEAAERIRANADRQRTVLRAEAYRDAETKRGEGDALAAETYAKAYTKDSEFYRFYRSLNAYRQSFNDNGDVMILQPDSEFFKYFENLK